MDYLKHIVYTKAITKTDFTTHEKLAVKITQNNQFNLLLYDFIQKHCPIL